MFNSFANSPVTPLHPHLASLELFLLGVKPPISAAHSSLFGAIPRKPVEQNRRRLLNVRPKNRRKKPLFARAGIRDAGNRLLRHRRQPKKANHFFSIDAGIVEK